jgi:hypothetical protein
MSVSAAINAAEAGELGACESWPFRTAGQDASLDDARGRALV